MNIIHTIEIEEVLYALRQNQGYSRNKALLVAIAFERAKGWITAAERLCKEFEVLDGFELIMEHINSIQGKERGKVNQVHVNDSQGGGVIIGVMGGRVIFSINTYDPQKTWGVPVEKAEEFVQEFGEWGYYRLEELFPFLDETTQAFFEKPVIF